VYEDMNGDTSKAVETNDPTHLSTDEKMLGMF